LNKHEKEAADGLNVPEHPPTSKDIKRIEKYSKELAEQSIMYADLPFDQSIDD